MVNNQQEKPTLSDEELEKIEKEEKKRGFRVRDVRGRETLEEKKPSEPEEEGSKEKPTEDELARMMREIELEGRQLKKQLSKEIGPEIPPEEELTQEEIDSLLAVFKEEPSAGEVSVPEEDKDLVVGEGAEVEELEESLEGEDSLSKLFARWAEEEEDERKKQSETAAETPPSEGETKAEEESVPGENRKEPEEPPFKEPETKEEILEDLRNRKGMAEENYAAALTVFEKADKSVKKLKGLRKFFASKEEISRTDATVEELENRQALLADRKKSLNEVLSRYRRQLLEIKERELTERLVDSGETGKELKEYAKQLMIETTVNEAIIIYNLKKETEIEISGGEKEKLSWLKTKGLEAAQWYRKQPIKQKILVAGVLLGTGVAAGIAGGAVGAALAGGALTGRWTQRVLGGAGTAVGLETWMKSSQEKAAKKEVSKILEEQGIETLLEEQSEALDKKLFELIGKKKGEERRRYLIAGVAGMVIGSGALSRAFREIVPDEWRQAVMGKLGFGRPAVPVEESSSAILPGEAQTGEVQKLWEVPGVSPENPPIMTTPAAPPGFSGTGMLVNAPEATIETDVWGQVNGIEEAYKGDSVWKMLERQIDARMGDDFDSLDKAQKFYVIDALKDKVAADPGKFGLINIDKIPVGQKIDFSEIFQDKTGVKDIISKAANLKPEQLENILKESEAFRKGLAAKAVEAVSAVPESPVVPPASVGEEIWGQGKTPESKVLEGIGKTLQPSGEELVPTEAAPPKGMGGLGRVTIPEELKAPPLEHPPVLEQKPVLPQEQIPHPGTPAPEQIPPEETHQVEKFEVKSEELPGEVRKEEVILSEDQFGLTGRENLNMERIGKLFNQGKISPFKIKLLEDHSRNISSYLNQLKKIDLFSEEAKTLKNSIKFIIDGNEKLYGKNIFSKEVYEILNWKK